MFIGIRDIKFARGRFALIVAVIAMMSFMVVALSALTNGLGNQSISAVTRLPGKTLVVQAPAEGQSPSLSESALDQSAVQQLTAGGDASRLGISTTRLTVGQKASAVTVFGADQTLVPQPESGAQPADGDIMISSEQADDLGIKLGQSITVGAEQLTVSGIAAPDFFAHTAVAYTTVGTWQTLAHGQEVSAVVLAGGEAPAVPGTDAMDMKDATAAVPGYSSEHGSLLAMQAMVLAISALVVGAFFTVWTQQRRHDLAVVRAMGGDKSYLLKDGIGQALLVLLVGQTIGAVLGIGLALAAGSVVPILLTVSGVLLPMLAMAALGLIGALLAVRTVTTVDPLVALQN
ncbi:ABC transporter permease [Tomitella biformata]|uniref:ABC transporter permease n=1 Tax=Tomitella biformata TaxID=630403 RepID=UPI000463548B|nr:ABC transporter permease [Tomitella biformata]